MKRFPLNTLSLLSWSLSILLWIGLIIGSCAIVGDSPRSRVAPTEIVLTRPRSAKLVGVKYVLFSAKAIYRCEVCVRDWTNRLTYNSVLIAIKIKRLGETVLRQLSHFPYQSRDSVSVADVDCELSPLR